MKDGVLKEQMDQIGTALVHSLQKFIYTVREMAKFKDTYSTYFHELRALCFDICKLTKELSVTISSAEIVATPID